jgi:hypothetical protein
MKNKTNNKLLILTTLAAISLSGCASKSIEVINKSEIKQVKVSKWKNLNKSKKEDCVDCYANIVKEPMAKVALVSNASTTTVYGYDYAQIQKDAYAPYKEKLEEYKNPYLTDAETEEVYIEDDNTYLVDASYREDVSNNENNYKNLYTKVEKHSLQEKNSRLLGKNSIQVGAFRKYAGAKVYAKRYSLLTSKYNVEIKENVKNKKPIYRVQIEGFSNEREANAFMQRYGLDGAFLVRR